MSKKVSIILPVYNSEDYIERCVESILNQTYKDFEIIIINDGSKDNSQEIIDRYKEEYPDTIVAIEQKNKGVARTRNYGIQIANGKYIMFIDNDDFMDKDYVETYVKNIEEDDLDMVIGGYRRPTKNGRIVRKLVMKNEKWSKYKLMAPWAKIYKKEFMINNELQFLPSNIGEDDYLTMQAVLSTDKIKIIEYVGYNWYYNEESVSNTTQRNIKQAGVYNLLNKSYDNLVSRNLIKKEGEEEYIELYFIRYVMWFLTYSTKRIKYSIIKEEYDKLFQWLKERFPNYKKNKQIGFNKPKGEELYIWLFVMVFMFMHKIRLGKLALFIYSRI